MCAFCYWKCYWKSKCMSSEKTLSIVDLRSNFKHFSSNLAQICRKSAPNGIKHRKFSKSTQLSFRFFDIYKGWAILWMQEKWNIVIYHKTILFESSSWVAQPEIKRFLTLRFLLPNFAGKLRFFWQTRFYVCLYCNKKLSVGICIYK